MTGRALVLNAARTVVPPVASDSPRLSLHARMPGYRPTPLHDAPQLADAWGVGRVVVKHEDDRFGLPSFKVLGASWAAYRVLCAAAELPADTPFDTDVRDRLAQTDVRRLVTATDGNHGQAVAWVARFFGLTAQVHIPADAEQVRVDVIRGEGADVRLVDGDYDAAVAAAAAAVDDDAGAVLLQDTFVPGHEQVPAWISQGYATLLAEVHGQLGAQADAVFVPAGVGSLAAAVVDHYAGAPTRIVTVEPSDAACLLASVLGGRLTTADGPHRTAMAGLNCATPSAVAWPQLQARLDACIAVTDDDAAAAMRALAGVGVRAGATGAAAAAGAAQVCADRDARDRLRLRADATVLLLVTEGVTDPAHHSRVTGRA